MGEALERHGFVAARYDAERLNPPEVVAGRTNPQRDGLIPYTYPPFLPHAGGSSLGVRRSLHQAVGGYDEDLPALEDTDYCWRIQLAGTELVFVPEAVVHIRYRAGTWALARQSYRFGIYNVLMCRRYRGRGMGRLPVLAGVARWVKMVLTGFRVLQPGAAGGMAGSARLAARTASGVPAVPDLGFVTRGGLPGASGREGLDGDASRSWTVGGSTRGSLASASGPLGCSRAFADAAASAP